MYRTPSIIIAFLCLCLLAFLWSMVAGVNLLTPTAEALRGAGALYAPDVYRGEYWRVLTAGLLHAGPLHLLFNGVALWVIGKRVEGAFGSGLTLGVVVASQLGTAYAAMWVHPYTVSVGASGIVMGLAAAFVVPLIRDVDPWSRHDADLVAGLVTFLLANVILALARPGIDWAGHLGGTLAGFLVVPAVMMAHRRPRTALVVVAAVIVLLGAVTVAIDPRDLG